LGLPEDQAPPTSTTNHSQQKQAAPSSTGGWADNEQQSTDGGRPDFSQRSRGAEHDGGGNDRGRKPDWRELAGVTSNETPEEAAKVVDNLLQTLQAVEVKLVDKQADVNSPLYSVKSFEQLGLDENLLKGLYAMKFVKPSKVQERALPLLLASPPQNMIAQSQSGTGKTAAFTLTMLSRVDPSLAAVQVIPPNRKFSQFIMLHLGCLCCAYS